MPSDFFVDLYMHHQKLVALLQNKIDEAENMASSIFDTAIHSKDESTESAHDLKQLKFKIFDICKLIYEEQREAGSQLLKIERKVEQLKSNFKTLTLQKKGHFVS